MIAFLTCARVEGIAEDDRPLALELERLGVKACAIPWDARGTDWRAYDALIVRSTWDYYLRLGEFLAFLDRLESERVRVFNPVPLLRWNIDKAYLKELESAGVPCVPTFWVKPGDPMPLEERLLRLGWEEAVMKPAVSAAAHGTFRFRRSEASRFNGPLRAKLKRGEVLLQPFLPEVAREGEWSFIFFGGEFSHAAAKLPAPGDFRVQKEHGGRTRAAVAAPADLAIARAALEPARRLCGGDFPLYARVDMIRHEGRLLLNELEVTEPSLYFGIDPGAAARFAAALVSRLA